MQTEELMTVVALLSTTVGQNFLIYTLFPTFMAAYGLLILCGLLLTNAAIAGLFIVCNKI